MKRRPFDEVMYIDNKTFISKNGDVEHTLIEKEDAARMITDLLKFSSTDIMSNHVGVMDNVRQKVAEGRFDVRDKFGWMMGFGMSEIYCTEDENKEEVCKINAKEFDKIKEIILCYNDKDYDGRYISEDMRKAMEDYYSIKFRNNYSHIPTLEERKLFVSFKSGLTLQQINDMAYRHFDIMYNQCIDNDLFFSQKIIQASEKYKVNEDEIVYPLFKKNDKFSFLQNADNFEKKVSAAAKGGY